TVHRLPVVIVLVGDEYRIARAAPEAKSLLGGAVVRIDDTPIAEVDARLRTIISMDESEPLVRGVLPARIIIGEILHGLKITPDATYARITAAVGGQEKTVDCKLVPGGTNPNEWPLASAAPPPLSRRHGDDSLYFTYIESARTVYVNFRRYDDLGSRS